MNHLTRTRLLLAGCALLAACSAPSETASTSSPDPEPATRTVEPTDEPPGETAPEDGLAETAPDGSSLPDGTWARTATTAQAQNLGLPRSEHRPRTGADGVLRSRLRLDGGAWAVFTDDGGGMALGDSGTAGYDAEGNWVAASSSTGCPGCVTTYAWSVDGRRLDLRVVDTSNNPDPMDVLVVRWVSEGTYRRVG